MDVALGVLLLLVVLAAVAVAFVRVYPEAAQRIGLDIVSWNPTLARPLGSATGVLSEGTDAVGARWQVRVIIPVTALFKTESTASPPAVAGFPAESCLECHQGYERRPLFSVVYVPHETHTSADIGCEQCHIAEGPGRDRVPLMAGCADCHLVSGRENCGICHPPGNVFHGSELAGDRELGFECGVCHNEEWLRGNARSHQMPVFDTEPTTCEPCHAAQGFCSRCHPAAHDPGYARRHAADLRDARRSHLECWTCHDALWCSMQCHARS